MSSSSTPPSKDENSTSYVNMKDVEDATLIGEHCDLPYCNQLDFLPFYCQSCSKTYCLDHRSETAHNCANAGAWAERKRLAALARPAAGEGKQLRDQVSSAKPCYKSDCKTTIGTSLVQGVHCPKCNRDYCLKHRLEDDHDCANVPVLGARPGPGKAAASARSALDKLKAWGREKTKAANEAAGRVLPKPKPTTASMRMIAVNNLKKTAKGDDKLAPEKRVYLYVEAEAATTEAKLRKGQFFYSKDWVIGRVLDAAARSLQVQNVNNASSNEQDKLRVFHVEGGRILEFNEKVGTALVSGNTITLLRGVGPPPDLIDLS